MSLSCERFCCQVEVSVSGWSNLQNNPTECDVSNCFWCQSLDKVVGPGTLKVGGGRVVVMLLRINLKNFQLPCTCLSFVACLISANFKWTVDSSWNVMAHGAAREGKWRGNWRMQWVTSTLHTTSEYGVSSIITADAHTSAAGNQYTSHYLRIRCIQHYYRWCAHLGCR